MALFQSPANRPFALLWSGQVISRLGDSLFSIALAWWVLQQTGSAGAMGAVLICANLPKLALSLLGGIAADRFPRISVMLTADLLRGTAVGLVALGAAMHLLVLWELLILSTLFGMVQAFFYPAYAAVIPDLVPSATLPSANALRSAGDQVAAIVGPGLAGAIVATGGTSLALALDGLSFLLSAACLVGVARTSVPRRTAPHPSSGLADLREGLVTVRDTPWLWITIAVAGVTGITLVGPLEAVLPLLVRRNLGAQVGGYALLQALQAVGALVATLVLGQVARLRRRGPLTYGGWLLACVMMIVLGLPIPFAVAAVALTITGAALAVLGLTWLNVLQELVPREQLGRVFSVDVLGSDALASVGYGLAGIAADHVGAAPTFVFGGAVSAAVIGFGLLHPAVRHLD